MSSSAIAEGERPMRVLLVIDSLGSGGAQRQMAYLARALAERGHSVTLFTYHPGNALGGALPAGVRRVQSSKAVRLSLSPALQVARLLREQPFHTVLAFLPTPSTYASLGWLIARSQASLVVSERSFEPAGRLPWGLRIARHLYRLADAVVVNSFHQTVTLSRRYPSLVGRLWTITNGVDILTFSPSAVSRDPRALQLLAVGNVSPIKNPLGLARALRIFGNEWQDDVRLTWVGKRSPHLPGHASYIAAVENEIAQLPGKVHWVWGGERCETASLLAAADGLVHPSLGEGSPNVIAEALASGLPVLAGRVADNGWLVADGIRGFLFDPRDERDIASTLARYASLPADARARMAAGARAFAQQHLQLDASVSRYERLFRELQAGRAPAKALTGDGG